MIGVGVVGYGYAGRSFHTYLVPLVQGLELRAIATRDPERRQRAYDERGVVTNASLAEMLDDASIQLVVLATPHDTHAELAIAAMNAGRHVVTDKVMCLNAREADTMIAAAHRNNVMLSVFQNRRWDWDYLTVRHILEQDLIGTPYVFETAVLGYRPPRSWRGERLRGGGILFDWGAHLLDQALQLVPGPVLDVRCHVDYRGWGASAGSYGRLLLRFGNGVLYQVECGNLARASKPRWFILGDKGAFVRYALDQQERALLLGNIDGASESPELFGKLYVDEGGQTVERPIESVRGSWKSYYQNVADHLLSGAPLIVLPEQVRRQMAIFDAAMESASTGQAIRPDGEEA